MPSTHPNPMNSLDEDVFVQPVGRKPLLRPSIIRGPNPIRVSNRFDVLQNPEAYPN